MTFSLLFCSFTWSKLDRSIIRTDEKTTKVICYFLSNVGRNFRLMIEMFVHGSIEHSSRSRRSGISSFLLVRISSFILIRRIFKEKRFRWREREDRTHFSCRCLGVASIWTELELLSRWILHLKCNNRLFSALLFAFVSLEQSWSRSGRLNELFVDRPREMKVNRGRAFFSLIDFFQGIWKVFSGLS